MSVIDRCVHGNAPQTCLLCHRQARQQQWNDTEHLAGDTLFEEAIAKLDVVNARLDRIDALLDKLEGIWVTK